MGIIVETNRSIHLMASLNPKQGERFLSSVERSILGVGEEHSLEALLEWIKGHREQIEVKIERSRFSDLKQWYRDECTGSYRHESGGFFRIDGIEVCTNYGFVPKWQQPIINQPEIGFLGILAKDIGGTLHFLMQAKIEPGNINAVQISPTLQATKSNYLKKHKGRTPKYLEYFQSPNKKIILDQLQSEQGARFLKKRNRNIIIYIEEDIAVLDGFIWMTLAQIRQISKLDNFVNMDTRTVFSGFRYHGMESLLERDDVDPLFQNILAGELIPVALYSLEHIIAWLTELKSKYELQVERIHLDEVSGWICTDERIYHETEKYFEVVPIRVSIANREVCSWDQPMIRPKQIGVCAFLIKKIKGVYHFLVQAKMECGNFDVLEFAPTIQCVTGSYKDGEVPFVHELEEALDKKEGILLDVYQSEEGGRFYGEQNRNIIVDVGETFREEVGERFIWMTMGQLKNFILYNNYVNIQARSLLAQI